MSADLEEEFPLLCATCLGENPMVRMTRQPRGKPCKVCERPFTIFRWKAGKNARMKKTELCKPCAQAKHVCQTCVLDIELGIPVQLRDQALAQIQLEAPQSASSALISLPSSTVGTNYALQRLEANGTLNDVSSNYSKAVRESPALQRLARTTPYYKRNEAHLCSFFARGECNRGELCPFRHEMPHATGDYNKQNIKDRYKGSNDVVASRMLHKLRPQSDNPPDYLAPPTDQSITTLWVGRLQPTTTESELQAMFGKSGTISRIHIHAVKSCAFITYASRADAESAAQGATEATQAAGFTLSWAKPKAKPDAPSASSSSQSTQSNTALSSNPSLPAFLAPLSLPPPPGIKPITYPSQLADYGAARLGPGE